MLLNFILVPTVVSVSVPFSELHEHAYLLFISCLTQIIYGNRVVRFLIFYYYYIQEHACPILMYGPKLFFLWFSKKGDVYINFTMPILYVSII